MITSGFSLAYNGKALLNNSKEMLWQRNIYQVTTATDGNGTITASPMSGYSGTNVTLSNTPNSGYDFANYSITGATLAGNQFTLNNDVTAQANFSAIPEPSALLFDEPDLIIARGQKLPAEKSINVTLGDFNYYTIMFDSCNSHDDGEWRVNPIWTAVDASGGKGLWAYNINRYDPRGWNYVGTAVGGYYTYEWYSKLNRATDWATCKLVLDISGRGGYNYWNNTYFGSAITNYFGGITLTNFKFYGGGNTDKKVSAMNFKIAGFRTLSDASAWNG